ncbi:MAG: PH domain-containing protein [Candidatus Limnocylindria bacterium]|nr:MAG: hypothetical protein DLM71_05330 [Chloroflexota bacterium]
MSYARNLLSRGEEVVFESRQHWFAVLASTWLWIVVAVAALAMLIWVGTNKLEATLSNVLGIAGLVLLLAAAGRVGLVVWGWRNQEYLVTTRRIIKSEGVLNKVMSDSSLEKVNDAHLTQSWLGRIFDYGHLDILTAADESGGIEDFPMIADPVKFKIAMLNQKELLERPDLAPPPSRRPSLPPPMQRPEAMPPRAGSARVSEIRSTLAADPTPSAPPVETASRSPTSSSQLADELAATLERLAALRDKGLITADEYEAKKRQLLERM